MRRAALALLPLVLVLAACGSDGSSPLAAERIGAAARPWSIPVPRDGRAVVWAVGDGAIANASSRRVARFIARDRPALVLYLGDVYASGTREEFRENMVGVYGAVVRRMAPTPGNHEWGNRAEGYDPFWRRVHGGRPPYVYALRVAGWQLVSLNSEGDVAPQVRWLRRATRAPGTCRLAFWHRPRFSAGPHGDDDDLAPLWDALRGRARLVLSGHDHDLQQLRPRDGITQLVSGAGGRDLYDVGDDPALAWGTDRRYGALRLVLTPRGASWRFVSDTGATLHRGSVRCG